MVRRKEYFTSVNVRIEPDLKRKLEKKAAEMHISLSQLLRKIIREA